MPAVRQSVEMLRFTSDLASTTWLAGRLHPFGVDTGSVIPVGFEAYARVFHPVVTGSGAERWSSIAARHGRTVHPEMQLHRINRRAGEAPPPDYSEWDGYAAGSLPMTERRALVELLRPATTTPDNCWLCVWEGWGGLDHQGVSERLDLPARGYLVAHGTVDDAVPSVLDGPWDQSPSIWWPDDRAWCVATEVDFAWTYVAGTTSLIESILSDERLEALRAELHHLPFHDSDRVNDE